MVCLKYEPVKRDDSVSKDYRVDMRGRDVASYSTAQPRTYLANNGLFFPRGVVYDGVAPRYSVGVPEGSYRRPEQGQIPYSDNGGGAGSALGGGGGESIAV